MTSMSLIICSTEVLINSTNHAHQGVSDTPADDRGGVSHCTSTSIAIAYPLKCKKKLKGKVMHNYEVKPDEEKKSRLDSHGKDSGVEILSNKPYKDGPGGSGQYTFKIYHIGSKIPGRLAIPGTAEERKVEADETVCKKTQTNDSRVLKLNN
ncbi:hypothetical protein COOONC_05953 [Cooperia oncophora]